MPAGFTEELMDMTMDTPARPIVIGGDGHEIPGIRYRERHTKRAVFLEPFLPQTDEEIEIVKRWLRAHGFPSYRLWEAYCQTMHRNLTEPVIEERVVVLEGEVVDDEHRSLPACREQRALDTHTTQSKKHRLLGATQK